MPVNQLLPSLLTIGVDQLMQSHYRGIAMLFFLFVMARLLTRK